MRKLLTFLTLGTALLMSLPAQAETEAGQRPGGHQRGEMMRMMDSDGDGKISKAEFVAGAEQRFAKMDKNGDGFLTKEDRPEGAGEGGRRLRGGEAPVPGVTTE